MIQEPSGHIVCPMLFSDRKRFRVASLRMFDVNECDYLGVYQLDCVLFYIFGQCN